MKQEYIYDEALHITYDAKSYKRGVMTQEQFYKSTSGRLERLFESLLLDEKKEIVKNIQELAYKGKGMTNYGADQYNEALVDAEVVIIGDTDKNKGVTP